MSKYFLIEPNIKNVSRTDIIRIEEERVKGIDKRADALEEEAEDVLAETDTLKRVHGRVIVKINTEGKNYHTFDDGNTIRIERRFNNLNRRETESCNAIVIDAENIPIGAEVLVYYNSILDTNKIFDYKNKSPYIGYYSIKEEDCYMYREGDKWIPIAPYETALRVFEPYKGELEAVKPKKLADTLYVTSGELKGNVVKTLRGCDFEIIFMDTNGKEGSIIIFRPNGLPEKNLEEEAIAILDEQTRNVNRGTLLIGLSDKNCKTLKEHKDVSKK
jgi:hypothetical protein